MIYEILNIKYMEYRVSSIRGIVPNPKRISVEFDSRGQSKPP